MPQFGDYIVFVDESGDHSLVSVDPTYPVFVLAFVLFRKREYVRDLVPAVLELKFRHFGHDQVILHEHDIRKNKGPFAALRDAAVREAFMGDLNRLIMAAPFTLIASVIDKVGLRDRYAGERHAYHVAMQFGLERVYQELNARGCRGGTTHILFERRGPKEDAEVEEEFERVCAQNATGHALPFAAVLCPKACNSPGLQLSDLVARPVGRKMIDPAQPNRAYDILEPKLRRSPRGVTWGWGLKMFPPRREE